MEIKLKKLHNDVVTPSYAKEGDAGMDIRAYIENKADKEDFICYGDIEIVGTCQGGEDMTPDFSTWKTQSVIIHPQTRVIIPTGFCIQLNKNQEAQIRPRSGQSLKKGFDVALGTIDSGYTGEIGVIVRNFTDKPITIEHGERIAQIVISKFDSVTLTEVDELNETERGEGGFGHTGK
jgi:dUTP pyrophosphatase